MGRISRVFLGLALAGAVGGALAQDIRADRAIKYRQGIMQAQGWNLMFLAAMVKGDPPYNKDRFLAYATTLEQVSHMAWEGYTPGSDQGAPNRAKPEIWKDAAKFKQAVEVFKTATSRLTAAARLGTLDAVKAPFGDVVKSCDNCHDSFRSK